MNKIAFKYRFLVLRRVFQVSLLFLYFIANAWGVTYILQGNLSSSMLLNFIPLSDPFAVLQMFVAGALIATNILVGAIIIAVIYILLGRVFCSWVCPINIITDVANFIRRKLSIDKIEKKIPISKTVRYYVLALSLILSYILGVTAFEFISPISIMHRGIIFGLGFGWAAMLIIFLFDLFVLKNGWCGYICPLGGFYSIIGKFSLIKVEHDVQKCTLCMDCKRVCPENQVLWMIGKNSAKVTNSECTNCGRCIEVCGDDALNFSLIQLIKKGDKK